MGTAGHIDHGKTALIRALTGIECDTHKEEKRRGITINLGFAHLDLPSGDSVGIVDVPGHRDFVHTMVAGASGIDFALMVVAADEGVMPQTREHLQIMQVLGIRDGVVALTKADLADNDMLEMAGEEAAGFVAGSFLQNASVVAVSSVTGQGLPSLGEAIACCAARVTQRPRGEVFRLFVDRIFAKSGFGTVVTGSVLGGALRTDTPVYLLPGAKQLRVRRMERHGHEVSEVSAGDRASLNLAGLEREDFKRGMLVADRPLHPSTLLDCLLKLFDDARQLGLWSQATFLLGTFEAQARIHLLDKERASGGETALVQIHLPSPCVAQAGDRFVLRSTSSDITLGGGEIIDSAPLHHRRRTSKLAASLERIARGKLPELIAMTVRNRHAACSHITLADALNASADEVASAAAGGIAGDIVVRRRGDVYYLMAGEAFDRIRKSALDTIAAFHRRNPLVETGRTVEELVGIVGITPGSDGEVMLRLMLEELRQEGALKAVAHTWALADHSVTIADDLKEKVTEVESFLESAGMQTPLMSELGEAASRQGIDQRTLGQILRFLTKSGRVHAVEGNYLHSSVVDRARAKLLPALAARPEGMTVAQFRDLVSGNRKICLLLYALFDSEGVTERRGDVRVITEKGRAALAGTP